METTPENASTSAPSEGAQDAAPQSPPAPRRKLYVHIGMHKTGTTAIQTFCSKNRNMLVNQHSILYPELPYEEILKTNHHYMIALSSCYDDKMLQYLVGGVDKTTLKYLLEVVNSSYIEDLNKEINSSNCDVIISSEAFYILDPQSVLKFASLFPSLDIVPIMYVRNFSDWLCSFYDTYLVHAKGTLDLLKATFSPFSLSEYIDRWSCISFDGKVRLVSYDEVRQRGLPLVSNFFSSIGIAVSSDTVDVNSTENVSNRPDILIMMRELRKSGASESQIQEIVKYMDSLKINKRQRLLNQVDTEKYDKLYIDEIQNLMASEKIINIGGFSFNLPNRNFQEEIPITSLYDLLKQIFSAKIAEKNESYFHDV